MSLRRKNDPYADDDVENRISQADERAQAQLREKAKAAPTDPNEPEEIDLDEAEEEEEEEREAAQPAGKTPRQEKRGNRWRQHTQRAAEAEERAKEAERQLQDERQRRIALETMQQASRREETPKENPLKKELDSVRQQQQAIWIEYNARGGDKLPKAEQDDYMARARELRDKETLLVVDINRPAQQQREQEDPERAATIARIRMDYPDVSGHPQARHWAVARYNQLVAEGKPATYQTAQVSLEEARKTFRLAGNGNGSPRPAPSQNLRQKLSGVPASGGGGLGGGNGEGKRVIVMTPDRKKMAEAWAPKGTKPAEAHKLWAQKVGSRLIQKGLA